MDDVEAPVLESTVVDVTHLEREVRPVKVFKEGT